MIPFQSSPFPLDTSIEMDLFQAAPMSDKYLQMRQTSIMGHTIIELKPCPVRQIIVTGISHT